MIEDIALNLIENDIICTLIRLSLEQRDKTVASSKLFLLDCHGRMHSSYLISGGDNIADMERNDWTYASHLGDRSVVVIVKSTMWVLRLSTCPPEAL